MSKKPLTPLEVAKSRRLLTSAVLDGHTHSLSEVEGLEDQLLDKQDALVSGSSIKTVNGESLLGAGDLEIGGSSSTITQITLTASGGTRDYAEFVVSDSTVLITSKLTAAIVPELDSENDLESLVDDKTNVWAIPEDGQVRFVLTANGPFVGPFKVNYGVVE